MPQTAETHPKETETKSTDATTAVQFSEKATDSSQPFIGQWNTLISTTNWEKGQIICQWRQSLEDDGATVAEYSDEAWAQLVGGVSPQHVGRLRRTSERFGHVFQEYGGIYWSHFYASLDWEDSEMWLEGAVQSKWSVSKMRQHRWETLGKIPGQEPDETDIVTTELKEEAQSLEMSEGKRLNDRDYIEGPVHEGPDFGDEDSPSRDRASSTALADPDEAPRPKVRPFESFTDLPDDVMEATSSFKVAIIQHKADDWSEIPKEDMLGLLDALKQLVDAPVE